MNFTKLLKHNLENDKITELTSNFSRVTTTDVSLEH